MTTTKDINAETEACLRCDEKQHHAGTLIPIAEPHPAIWQENVGIWWCCNADYPNHEPSCEYHEARDIDL